MLRTVHVGHVTVCNEHTKVLVVCVVAYHALMKRVMEHRCISVTPPIAFEVKRLWVILCADLPHLVGCNELQRKFFKR